jgi:hypothetical protein
VTPEPIVTDREGTTEPRPVSAENMDIPAQLPHKTAAKLLTVAPTGFYGPGRAELHWLAVEWEGTG